MRAGREIVERKLAKIKSTYLAWEDHGIFTFILDHVNGHSVICFQETPDPQPAP